MDEQDWLADLIREVCNQYDMDEGVTAIYEADYESEIEYKQAMIEAREQ